MLESSPLKIVAGNPDAILFDRGSSVLKMGTIATLPKKNNMATWVLIYAWIS